MTQGHNASKIGSGSPSTGNMTVAQSLTTLAEECATLRLQNQSLQRDLQGLRDLKPAKKREKLLTLAFFTMVFWLGFTFPNWTGLTPPDEQFAAQIMQAWQRGKVLATNESGSAPIDLFNPEPETVERSPEATEADVPKTTPNSHPPSQDFAQDSSSLWSSWANLFWASKK